MVLDLRYEARDIDQNITSQAKIDQWFELKTQGLTDFAKAQLKQRWGTMQKALSARDRLHKIVDDIQLDMETRDRLKSGHGNAILVSGSIYSACRFFEMLQHTDLAGKCAIVTSYKPSPGATTRKTSPAAQGSAGAGPAAAGGGAGGHQGSVRASRAATRQRGLPALLLCRRERQRRADQ